MDFRVHLFYDENKDDGGRTEDNSVSLVFKCPGSCKFKFEDWAWTRLLITLSHSG